MPLNATQLGKVAEQLLEVYQAEKDRFDVIAGYMTNRAIDLYIPKGANAEYKMLVEQSRFNVLPLVVTAVAQNLFIDGYRPTSETGRAPSSENAPIWDEVWQPNRMDARQAAIYRPAITYGISYVTVVPGTPVPVLTPHSPRRLTALYEDELNDDWPQYAMVTKRPTTKSKGVESDIGAKLTIYDDEFRYEVTKGPQGWELAADAFRHGLGVVPVVRFLDEWNGDEVPKGKIEPLLPPQKQLNQTTFGLSMAQQYGAFKQRWVTGMTDESPPFQARVDAMLRSDSTDTKFGEFDATDLNGYLNSRDKTLLFVSAVAQIPPHQLVIGAGISNISAEALVALQTGHERDVAEHKTSFGESAEQTLRLAGKALGGDVGTKAWEDTSAQVVWRDTTPRSLAQVADALGKLALQLGIPAEALWERIPGVTDQDIKRWRVMRDEADVMGDLAELVNGAQEVPNAVPSGNGANPLASV